MFIIIMRRIRKKTTRKTNDSHTTSEEKHSGLIFAESGHLGRSIENAIYIHWFLYYFRFMDELWRA